MQMDLNDAVERAITECIQEGILAEFLQQNRAEVYKVSIFSYQRGGAKLSGHPCPLILSEIKKVDINVPHSF